MFKKITCTIGILCLAITVSNAQLSFPEEDRISHHLGIQVNPLLNEIISFGGDPDIDNPFLIKYGIRFNQSRTEILFGFGYNYFSRIDQDGLESDQSTLFFRAGYSKKVLLGKRFEGGVSLDLIANPQNTQTINVQSFGGPNLDSTITTTKSSGVSFGAGPQLTLDYYITNNIKIGTEASLYFLRTQNTLNVKIQSYFEDFNGNQSYVESNLDEEETLREFNLQLPVALFLTIIF